MLTVIRSWKFQKSRPTGRWQFEFSSFQPLSQRLCYQFLNLVFGLSSLHIQLCKYFRVEKLMVHKIHEILEWFVFCEGFNFKSFKNKINRPQVLRPIFLIYYCFTKKSPHPFYWNWIDLYLIFHLDRKKYSREYQVIPGIPRSNF